MTGSRKRLLIILGSLSAFALFSAAAFVFLADINSYRPKIEKSLSGLLGMDFKINGRMGMRLFPDFGFYLEEVSLKNRGVDLASIKKVNVGLRLVPLLRHEVLISRCDIVNPVFSVVRDENGVLNFESPGRRSAKERALPIPLFTAKKFTITDGSFSYTDRKSGTVSELKDFSLAIRDLSLPGTTEDFLKNASFSGDLTTKSIRVNDFTAGNLRCSLKGEKGVFDFGSLEMEAFGGKGRGDVKVDIRGAAPHLSIRFKSPVFSMPESAAAARTAKSSPAAVTSDMLKLENVDLDIADLSFSPANNRSFLNTVSLSGNLRCGYAKMKQIGAANLTLAMRGERGLFTIHAVTTNFLGGSAEGTMAADFASDMQKITVRVSASKFHSEKFMETFSRKKIVRGEMDILADLEAGGKTWAEMRKKISGTVLLKGDNLVLYNLDLDRVLSKIRESQSFSLVDVGAYFFVGPFGPLLSKGYNFADIAAGSRGGQSVVRRLVSKWRVKNSVATAEDVALATRQSRLALKGKLDFVGSRFDNVTVGVLDKNGCAIVTQKISGPFSKPLLEKPNVPKSVIAPVTGIFEKVKRLFGAKCSVFYDGSVKHPVN